LFREFKHGHASANAWVISNLCAEPQWMRRPTMFGIIVLKPLSGSFAAIDARTHLSADLQQFTDASHAARPGPS
jgi:hypothetical protein